MTTKRLRQRRPEPIAPLDKIQWLQGNTASVPTEDLVLKPVPQHHDKPFRKIGRSPLVRELFAPLSMTEFMREYFEKKPFYLPPNAKRARLIRKHPITVDDLLMPTVIPHECIHILRRTNNFLTIAEGRKVLQAGRLADFIRRKKGSAIVHGIQHYFPFWKNLIDHFGRHFGSPAGINAYLTAGGQQTYSRHWDNHDVFILQLSGAKRWKVSAASIHRPLHGLIDSPPTKGLIDAVLRPGSFLYVPRGCPHEAVCEDETSLHLTIGLYSVTRFEVLDWALRQVLKRASYDPFFRESIYEYETGPANMESLFSSFSRRICRHFSNRDLRGLYDLNALGGFTDNHPVASRARSRFDDTASSRRKYRYSTLPYVVIRRTKKGYFRVVTAKGQLLMPLHFKRAFRAAVSARPFSARDAKKLSLDHAQMKHFIERLQLARLINEAPE